MLLATGGTPRVLDTAVPDGERILSWRDVYDLTELPEHLVVIGSGVTGAEFASGYSELGVPVTLVSSRDRVLPGEDPDAADGDRAGVHLARRHAGQAGARGGGAARRRRRRRRAASTAGRSSGSHALMCVGSVPEHRRPGARARRRRSSTSTGYIAVDRVSRTTVALDLRRRGLHRRAAAGLGRRHAGPHRDVARAGRGGRAAAAEDGGRQRLHPSRDRDGRHRLRRRSRPATVPART